MAGFQVIIVGRFWVFTEVLGNRPMVEALLSRLRHYCHTVHIKGPSLREPQG